jgi:hypothetical protein
MLAPPDPTKANGACQGAAAKIKACGEQSINPSRGGVQGRCDALFTARPRGTRWAIAAISPDGEAVKLGVFPHRTIALEAAAIMAGACGGRFLP